MTSAREPLRSRPRWQKLLPWLAALLLAAGVLALIVKFVPSSNGNTDLSKTQHPTKVAAAPKTVQLAPGARQVAGTFVLTAVRRRHLEKAWNIIGPEIRQGMTFKQWMTGNIPVVPYLTPTDITPMKIDYSFKNQALVEVAMVPKKGYKGATNIFWLELRRVGPDGHKHWLVWSWTPREAPRSRSTRAARPVTDAGGPGFAARLLSSPRRRRRLRNAGILLVLGGVVAFVGLHYSNTGHKTPEHFSSAPVQTVAAPLKPAALSSTDREVVRQVAARFIDTAVLRRHVDASWAITTAKLRQGLTRRQWDTGAIPVTPYPAAAVRAVKYQVDWSGDGLVYLKIAIQPKATSNSLGQAFDIGLTRTGRAVDHRWLVDYWVPLGGGVVLPTAGPLSKSAAATAPAASEPKSRLPVALVFVPVGLLIAILIGLPTLVFGRQWHRNRRALREYRKHQAG